jgi:predicted transcriptional regulator
MRTKTITVNVREDVEEKFRKLASAAYGRRKGYLGKAITEAMIEWEKKKAQSDVNVRAIEMLRKGFKMGGLKTKDRSEWHER